MLIGGWNTSNPKCNQPSLSLDICVKLHLYPYLNKGRMIVFAALLTDRGGDIMYMGAYYNKRTTFDLQVLRSKKYNRLMMLRKEVQTYTVMKEVRQLNEQISWIDAVLESRKTQLSMF